MAAPISPIQYRRLNPSSSDEGNTSPARQVENSPERDLLEPSTPVCPSLVHFDHTPWSYSDLNHFVKTKLENLQRTCVPPNLKRDRYNDMRPFLFNQVFVDEIGTNASRIYFPENDLFVLKPPSFTKYIASCAPLAHTLPIFMEMLIQESIPLIISLTNFQEGNRIKATPYLPYKQGEMIIAPNAEYKVICTNVDLKIDLGNGWFLEKRDFELETLKTKKGESHRFTQLHLPSWEDFSPGSVDSIAGLIAFTCEYRKKNHPFNTILVHCSAGAGRSGAFINCSEAFERFLEKKPVNISEIAFQSRMQRHLLGGNGKQYRMVFQVMEKLALAFGEPYGDKKG
ncbi:MAG: hypothetical protein HYZ48_04455 [Chlamydiales bacterium]|nr:hypothetical protein [Chlamydiales bacterium]